MTSYIHFQLKMSEVNKLKLQALIKLVFITFLAVLFFEFVPVIYEYIFGEDFLEILQVILGALSFLFVAYAYTTFIKRINTINKRRL